MQASTIDHTAILSRIAPFILLACNPESEDPDPPDLDPGVAVVESEDSAESPLAPIDEQSVWVDPNSAEDSRGLEVEDVSIAAPASQQACSWLGWGCGTRQCASGLSMRGVDFNYPQSEGCWGAGNDYDEPFRQIECCTTPAVKNSCYWTDWTCGQISCAPGHIPSGVDFNATKSEGCWGAGNDYDEPLRRLKCCEGQSPPPSNQCYWQNWGCGTMTCGPDAYLAAIDFNAVKSEGCWGSGNDYDEPFRRIYCCNY